MAVMNKDTIWKLTGCIQHYPWGGTSFIPKLISLSNDERKPFAELWFGQHPACPSVTSGGSALSDLMASSPEIFLTHKEIIRWEGELPFLCKILDVREMLSIQIHPDKKQAKEGYQLEKKKQVSLDSFKRTFRDANHKPEIMYALSDFYLLHDFRQDNEVISLLSKFSSLDEVTEQIKNLGLDEFYRMFMKEKQSEVNALLAPYVAVMKSTKVSEDPMSPEYWIKRAIDSFCSTYKVDRGILSFYFMNLIHLMPGEVIFQDSGIPHAYLQGQNIEIMANSDNVIRGGLTKKHVNAGALSRLVRFDKRKVHRLVPKEEVSQLVFSPPVDEFQLTVIDLDPYREHALSVSCISLIFSTCNCFIARTGRQDLRVSGGEAILVRSGETVILESRMKAKVFCVTTPG